jgi:DNA sulfur modification protein DndC
MVDYTAIMSQIQEQYLTGPIPWVIGFSGGKDSTTVLQMIFYALSSLPEEKLHKQIHVICNDTLVENPAIAKHVDEELKKIEIAGKSRLFKHNPDLFSVIKVKPKLEDTFWVNLIGKGYPSPNRWFRWCTQRMKINPTNDYILSTVSNHGQAIIVLGTRKAESANRALAMKKYDNGERLHKHRLPNAFVYSPIADLSNNEVWAYLLQAPNPWGGDNKKLLKLYGNACSSGECPFVIETGTQSCGKSRFGCWVCTVVDRDKSMENFIDNGEEWMQELLNFRNWIYDIRQEIYQCVPSNLNGSAKFGPFLIKTRREILDRLLQIQKHLPIELITPTEYNYIQKLINRDAENQIGQGLSEFVFELSNDSKIATVSDFNITQTSRKRLGSISLKRMKLIKINSASLEYSRLTRVIYYSI